MRMFAIVVAILASTIAAQAYSGAEFLNGNRPFAEGYAWGIFEARVNVFIEDPVEQAKQRAVWECFNTAGINSDSFVEGVRSFIQSDPKNLTDAALAAVLRTIAKMCPAAP